MRAELFNLFNHPNFNSPSGLLNDPNFGKSTSTVGDLVGVGTSRQAQLALKFIFQNRCKLDYSQGFLRWKPCLSWDESFLRMDRLDPVYRLYVFAADTHRRRTRANKRCRNF